MITIAVCDDCPNDLRMLGEMVAGYAARRPQFEIVMKSFSSPHELLAHVEQGRFYDIYVLDILMPGVGGIELGRYIRERNDSCAILFSTVTPEYALDAFCVQAQNYLVKPFHPEAFCRSLDRAIRCLKEDGTRGISFRTSEGLTFLPFHQITYISLAERRMEFHQTDGTVTRSLALRGSFEEALADLLTVPRFLQTHKSFVVNMDHVHMSGSSQMVLDDKTVVPMSARRQAAALDRYFTYLYSRHR